MEIRTAEGAAKSALLFSVAQHSRSAESPALPPFRAHSRQSIFSLGATGAFSYHLHMDKKEIKSPKLTANFLLWIGLFLLAMILLIAHFVWRVF